MGGASVTLRRADEDAISSVEALLERNDLPSGDVRSKPDCFYLGYDGETPVAVVGLEVRDTAGLLRSLVVEESERGNGFGTATCDALETAARGEGVETLYLLTTTASSFFTDRGYAVIERASAPAAIRRTTEFAELCPASATCMAKPL